MLECVFRFVCLMRERYLSEAGIGQKKGRVVLVGHDWYVPSFFVIVEKWSVEGEGWQGWIV